MKAKDLDKDILTDLYLNKRKTAYEIAEILQVNRATVVRYLKKYSIAINPKQRKFEIIKKVPLTKEQKEMIFGTLLGDGCIAPHGRKNLSYRLIIGHCEKQKDLLLWKKAILGNLVNSISIRKNKKNQIMNTFTSVTHNEFKMIYDFFYENNKKVIKTNIINYITPLSFAVWIMDDGNLNKNVNLRLSTDGFSEEDNVRLQDILRINFDIKCKVCKYSRNDKEYFYLSLNKENTIKATKLTEKYFVDCMRYKLYSESSTTEC